MDKDTKVIESNTSQSLTNTLKDSDLLSMTSGLGEVALDGLLEDGVLKDIPILGSILGIGKVATNIRDRLFTKKLISFLDEVSSVEPCKRKEEIEKIESDPKYQTKIGENLLFIIDKCDDTEKSIMIAKFFAAFLKEEITYDEYLHASSIVNQLFINDINNFVSGFHSTKPIERVGHLANTALYKVYPPPLFSKQTVGEKNMKVGLSKIGLIVLKVLRSKK